MKRIVLDHLDDILENAIAACEFVGSMSGSEFAADRKTLYALLRALEVIGEAAKRVPPDTRARHTNIDWRGMAGLRDIIIHQYDRIDHSVAYHVVTAQLPAVVAQLRRTIATERRLAGEPTGESGPPDG